VSNPHKKVELVRESEGEGGREGDVRGIDVGETG